jgi:transposase
MLSLVLRTPDPPVPIPRVLGVDDFAFKRSYVYGSILVDCETGAPIDLLEDREADTFARWLAGRAGIEVICRDRAAAYASAAGTAAPSAIQIADRWHVWKNLCETVEKAVTAHRSCLTPPQDGEPPLGEPVLPAGVQAANTRRRHAQVHALYDKGVGIGRIAEQLGLDRKTVRRYARAATADEMITTGRRGRRALAPFVSYLNQRWSEGCTDSGRLHRELERLDYLGSARSVRRWLEPLRALEHPLGHIPETPSVRQVATWLTRHPDALTSEEALRLTQITERCPELADTAGRVRGFAKIMDRLDGARRLPGWVEATAADAAQPMVRNFARTLRKDFDAVVQGLTSPFNSGVVEGRVTDLKAIKRQMAGRAGFRLLRKRVLLVAASRRTPSVTSGTTS